MNRDRWQQIESLFNAAQGVRGGERARLLASACAGDEDLRREVESLLDESEFDDDFLTEPVLAAGLQLLARERRELPGGRLIGHYRVIRMLGRGGMGEVYLAEDTRLGRRVSLKLLSSHLTGDAESVARFRREARAASGVSHRSVAHVYDFGEAEGRYYLAMEYVEGHSLREVLGHESLSVAEAVALARQVAAALSAAHWRGVVHRDIKPENIVVTSEGHAKVLDFGLAKLLEAGERVSARAAHTHTHAHTQTQAHSPLDSTPGLIMGTVAYMSPEQLRGEEVDARADLWSLGVVLYEMVARRRPFEGETQAEQIASILGEEPPAVAAGGRAAEELNRVLLKALAKERGARYQTADEFAHDLSGVERELEKGDGAGADSPLPGSPPGEAGHAPQSRQAAEVVTGARGRRGLTVTAVLLFAALAVAAAYFFKPRRGSEVAPPLQRGAAQDATAVKRINSLVIFPLETEGGGEEMSYLAEGVAEDLIRALGKLGKARVIALSSARKLAGREDDYADVRRTLNVDFLLAGRATQGGDGSLTVSVYLVDLERGEHVWDESYVSPSGELLYVRNALFVLLSNRLQTMLAGDRQLPLPPASTLNPEAYREYLRGTYSRERRSTEGLKRAVASLERAVELDPHFAMAYTALGDSYNLLGSFMGQSPTFYLPKARAAILRALALDEALAPAHASLAKMKMDYDRDWAGAEREFRRAIELNPGYAQAHHWYGEVFLSAMGRLDESLRELRIAHELDPLSDGVLTGMAWSHIGAHDYERAAEECRRALALDPDDWSNYSYLSMAQLKLGRFDEAIENAKKAYEMEQTGDNLAVLGAIYGHAGMRDEASKILRELEAAPASFTVSKYDRAIVHASLGQRDAAFRLLGGEVGAPDVGLLSIRIDPMLDTLRDDPRFPALEARYNFPPRPSDASP